MQMFLRHLAVLTLAACGATASWSTVYESCKGPCFPLAASVSSCVHSLNTTYSVTYKPSENTIAWDGDVGALLKCACDPAPRGLGAECTNCVNQLGCTGLTIDYNKLCTEPGYAAGLVTQSADAICPADQASR
jgi:hypothetical protein